MSNAAVMQPTYFPWIGLFDLIDRVDVFVHYDDVKVVKSYWDVRNRIKTATGEQYISVPLQKTKSSLETTFVNAHLNEKINWQRKHINALRTNYSKTQHFKTIFPQIEEWLTGNFSSLAELNIFLIDSISGALGIETKTCRSSKINGLEGTKDIRLVNLLRKIDCEEYLSPKGAKEYINSNKEGGVFQENGIRLYYHHFEHPVYPQLYGEFISHLSVLDLLFNCGWDEARKVIRSGRRPKIHYKDF